MLLWTYQSTACLTAPAALRAARSEPELNDVSECDPFFTVGSLITVRWTWKKVSNVLNCQSSFDLSESSGIINLPLV